MDLPNGERLEPQRLLDKPCPQSNTPWALKLLHFRFSGPIRKLNLIYGKLRCKQA